VGIVNYILLILSFNIFIILYSCQNNIPDKKGSDHIKRKTLVKRHIPALNKADSLSPFTVGNGEFAYTVDITGLQTFPGYYESGIPLCTQSQWGWHTCPNPQNYTLEQTFRYYDTYGRQVSYASMQDNEAAGWLRSNPHRLHLGRFGFRIIKSDSTEAELSDITNINQSLDIWEGIIKSSFDIEKNKIVVRTCCHPELDQIAVNIKSKLLKRGCVAIVFDFPYGSMSWGKNGADWESPDKHSSDIVFQDDESVIIERKLDSDKYFVNIIWRGTAEFKHTEKHSFVLVINSKKCFNFICCFSKEENIKHLPDASETLRASGSGWKSFWETGGAIDLSGSKDSRAHELERRIILSRYLTAIQCAGKMPPQETGLTFNSWYGKFHLEMHWWHAVHFVLWGHPELLEKSLAWYSTIMPVAKQKAERQGYEGVRWPKMIGYDGRESPSKVGVFLIWQQPHPIYYAEILYRSRKNRSTLEKYMDIVFATADFMASYAQWDEKNGRYVLGPPLIPAQEIHRATSTINPAFELSYWAYGLETAQKWRERLGLERIEKWDHILKNLSELPANNGLYQNAETALNTFADSLQRIDHPSLLGAYGMLPNKSADINNIRRTLEKVLESWNWKRTWGWDYSLIAMTAARVGRPDLAIDALLMDVQKNTCLNNGHNYQDERLPVYLPGNGGLLTAVAMMAAGWDGAPAVHAPGFPGDGNWVVKFEGLSPLP
jgi:hypothetical protein